MQKNGLPYFDRLKITGCAMLLVVMVIMISSSCKKSFSSTEFKDDKLVVLAEITAGDSMEIPIGKTIRVGNGGLIRFEKVKDATVVITDLGGRTFMLMPSWLAQYAANPTTVFTNRRHFRPGTTYFIEINHPTLGVTKASTQIPTIPKLLAMDTSSETYQGKDLLGVTITWQDDGAIDNNYVIEALKELVKINRHFLYNGVSYNYDMPNGKALYEQVKNMPGVHLLQDTIPQNKFTRLNIYTDDVNADNKNIDNLTSPFRRIFIPGQRFSGQIYTTKAYIDRQFLVGTDVAHKGRVRIQLKSASKELYGYLLTYEKYKTDFGSVPAGQLVSPNGNIQNGLGIFGGSSRREKVLYFDKF